MDDVESVYFSNFKLDASILRSNVCVAGVILRVSACL